MGEFEVKYYYLHDVEELISFIPSLVIVIVILIVVCGIFHHDDKRHVLNNPGRETEWHTPPCHYSLNQTRYATESEVQTPMRPTSYAQAVRATQRAASQRVASHRLTFFRREVHFFVQRLVGLFKAQRRDGYQFAVLCITHERNTTTNIQFWTRKRAVCRPDEATDNSSATFPPHNNLFVTRPDGPDHAEARLISRYDMLLRSYQS